jgi:hypothetical protein
MTGSGQNRQGSDGAYVFRFAPDSGHRSAMTACRRWAKKRHMQCSKNLLLDHLIGADEDCLRDGQPDGLRGLEVEDQLELRDLLHWEIGRFDAF